MRDQPLKDVTELRRDFLYVATGSFTAEGVTLAMGPLLDKMNPGSNALAGSDPRQQLVWLNDLS